MKRGEVVEVDWRYSDSTRSKVRPAVVVQADYLDGLVDDTILVKVTSKRFGIPGTEVEMTSPSRPRRAYLGSATPPARTLSHSTRRSSCGRSAACPTRPCSR